MMATATENSTDMTTEAWMVSCRTVADQREPATRHLALETYARDFETAEIERNAEFHATILRRLRTPGHSPERDRLEAGSKLGGPPSLERRHRMRGGLAGDPLVIVQLCSG